MTHLRFEEGRQLLKLALSALLAMMLLVFGCTGPSHAAELRFNRAYVGSLSGQTFATGTLLNADPGSIRFADAGTQRVFQNTSGTLYYRVGGVQYAEAGVLNSRYPNGNTMIDAVAFTANSGGDRLLVLGGSYAASASYSGSSNSVVAKLNEYLDATAPDAGQTTLSVNGGSSATVSVGQTATILVTVKLSSGAGLAGANVTLNASPSANTTISPASAVTNSSGQATFSVQSSAAGSVIYSATASANGSTFTSTATVTVTSVGVRSPAQSSAVVPNGSAGLPTLVTITVRDSSGNPVSGAAAALSASIGGSNAGTSVSAITDRGGGSYGFSYTPTSAGTDAVSIKLDGTNISGSPYTSLVAAPTFSFAPAPGGLPGGSVGTAYSQTITVTGGIAPYSFSATGLPAGLALNAATGTISGTPTTAGSYTLTITVTDANGATGSSTYNVAVGIQAPVAGASAVTVAANGGATTVPLSLTGGAATSVAVATAASHGTATASGSTISYTPNAGFSGSDSFTYTATNSAGTSAPATVTVTVSPPTLVFSPAPGGLPNGTVGAASNLTITVTGGTAPYSFSATGLPAGLTLNATTGAITGTPSTAGNSTIAITATDTYGAGGSATYVLNISIQAPVAGSTSLAVVANSAATAVPLSLSGGAAASVAVAAAPGHGIATASGTAITYVPDAGFSGSDSFTYTATNAAGTSAPATVTVTVSSPTLSFAPAPGGLPNGTVGTAYNQTITLTGGTAPYSFTATGLPAGLSLSAATGVVSGTPTTAGSYTVVISATDAHGATGSATYTVAIGVQAPVANASAVAVPANSSATAVPLSLAGGAATNVAVATAPSHGTATASGTAISYTPTAGFSGVDSFTYTATNSGGTSAPAMVTVTVSAPTLVFSPAPGGLPNGAVGTAYSQTITVAGGTAPYSFSATGLPAGLTLTPATGAISGTPTSAGSYTVTILVTDAHGIAGSATYTVAIGVQAPVAGASTVVVAANSGATTVPLSLVGGAAISVAVVTAPSQGTATASGTAISYTPNAGFSGTDSFTYTGTNTYGTSAPAMVTVTVSAPILVFSSAPGGLPNGTVGNVYSQTVAVTGGTAPYSFTATGLPAGLSLTTATGVISGTPTTAGSYTVIISAMDAHGATGSATYTVAIGVQAPVARAATFTVAANSSATAVPLSLAGGAATSVAVATVPSHGMATASGTAVSYTPNAGFSGADSFTYTASNSGGTSAPATVTVAVSAPTLAFSPAPGGLPDGTVGTAYNQTITATGGTSPYSFTAAGLPAGLTINAATGVISGAPTIAGSNNVTISATDGHGATGAATYTISISVQAPVAGAATVAVAANSSATAVPRSLAGGAATSVAGATAPAHGTATATGTAIAYAPNAGFSGTDSFTYTATNAAGTSAPATVTVTVSAPTLVFSPAPGGLPNGTVGAAYNQTITASGGTAPYSFSATGLPAGLTLNATTGAITGMPATDGSFEASVTATDAYGAVLAQRYSIVIAPPPPPVAADSTSASVPANTETKAGQNVAINLTNLVSGEYTDIRIVRQPQHGSVAITRTVAMRAGGTPGIMAALAVFGMLELPSQVIAIYTPDPNYHGPDSFQFAAVGPGGVSAPASVVINVVGRIPRAQALTANTLDGQPVLVDLTAGATEGPFVDATIVSVSPAQEAAAEIVPGGSGTSRSFKARVTPKARFSGAVLVQYTLTNAFGTSAPAVVTVNVTRRPDPSADPVVQAISDGQAEAARRFSQAQVSNFLRRAETLHGDCGHSFNGVRVASRDAAPPAAEPRSDDPAEMRSSDRTKETRQQQRANAKRGVDTGCRSVAVWSGGTVELGTRDAATGRAKISAATSGLSGGVDAKLGQGLFLGAGAGLSRDISRIDGGKARLFSKGTTLALYGSAAPVPGLFVDGVATTSWMTFRTRRTDATTGALASGERSSRLTSFALSMGIDRLSGPLGWSVYGRAATSNGSLHGYVEEGAGVYDLRFDSRSIRSTTGTLGFRTALRQALPSGSMTVNLRGEWQHEFQGGSLQGVDYADIAGPSVYRLRAQSWGREQFVLAPGIDLELPADWQFSVNLGFRGAADERAMSTSVRARKQF